jgi:hypothetical protein
MLLGCSVECVGRTRGDRRFGLGEGGQILVLILVGLVVDEAEDSIDGLSVKENGNGSLTIDEQSAVQTERWQIGWKYLRITPMSADVQLKLMVGELPVVGEETEDEPVERNDEAV